MKTIHTSEEVQNEISKENVTVLLFTTKWCGDCMYIKPFLPQIESAYPDYTFCEIDRDERMDLAQELDVMGIPSFVVFKSGKEISRFVSSLRKTKAEIESFLDQINVEVK